MPRPSVLDAGVSFERILSGEWPALISTTEPSCNRTTGEERPPRSRRSTSPISPGNWMICQLDSTLKICDESIITPLEKESSFMMDMPRLVVAGQHTHASHVRRHPTRRYRVFFCELSSFVTCGIHPGNAESNSVGV